MPSKTLTDRFLASNLEPPVRTNYFDTTVQGLALRVTPTGAKSWSFVYRLNGPSQWLAMGTYPALKLADARELAKKYRRVVDDKRDPAAERRAELELKQNPELEIVAPVLTVSKWALGGFITFQKGKKKTWKDDENKLKKYIVPAWGELPLESITRKMASTLLTEIAALGLTVGVNRIQMLGSRMFTVAINQGVIDQDKRNPFEGIFKLFDETPRERVLSDKEIRSLHTELEEHPSEAADVIWLRLLLGQRGEETAGAIWKELNLEDHQVDNLPPRTWFLNGVRTKNGKPHMLWLPDTAIEIFKRARARVPESKARVFPSLTEKNSQDERALYGVAATFENFDWRDLRRTFSTGLGNLGIDDGVIDRLLNHVAATIGRKHYNHAQYLPEKQVALSAWERELTRILNNEKKKSNVLPMAR